MGNRYETHQLKASNNKKKALNQLAENERELLFLIPLVQVAWAHGAISPRERQLIFEAARSEGIDERHPHNNRLADWLVYQPSRRFFDECLQMINEELLGMTVKERELRKEKILDFCTRIAAAAGDKSLMDVEHFISTEERETMVEISAMLNHRPRESAFGI